MKIIKISGAAGVGKTIALNLLQQHFGGVSAVPDLMTAKLLKTLIFDNSGSNLALGKSCCIFLDEVNPKNMRVLEKLAQDFHKADYAMGKPTAHQAKLRQLRRTIVYCAGIEL